MLVKRDLTDKLVEELADLKNFERLLRCTPIRQILFMCVTSLLNRGTQLAVKLRQRFINRFMQEPYVIEVMKKQTTDSASAPSADSESSNITDSIDKSLSPGKSFSMENEIQFGLRLGSFLSEAGCLWDGIDIFKCIALYLSHMPIEEVTTIYLDCLRRLLHSEICLNNFNEAKCTHNILVKLLDSDNLPKNLIISCYIQLAEMHFARNEYKLCHMRSLQALKMLENSTPERIAIDAMRQAAKACIAVGHFQRALFLILHAISRAKRIFGGKHQKYADTLIDYGYVLLNVDALSRSVAAYGEALYIKRCIFGLQSFYVAIAYEELSYACYKQDNSGDGDFIFSYYNIEIAIAMFKNYVPEDHLKMVSVKQIKALLLEKLDLENINMNEYDRGLLKESEDLYKGALQQSLEGFGEKNLRTAELYHNLGSLYIRIAQYKEAERMFKKAIEIKSDCMFPFDYGVETSIGELASLYCYKMKKYREAEKLYLRCIEITLQLFGDVYSGLEDYYGGLCYVYTKLGEYEKHLEYTNMLHTLRQNLAMQNEIIPAINENCSLEDIKEEFNKTPHPEVNFNPRPKLF